MSINNDSINSMTCEELKARLDEIIKKSSEDQAKGVVNPNQKEIDEEFMTVSDRIRVLSSQRISLESSEMAEIEMNDCEEKLQRLKSVVHRLNVAESRRQASQNLSYYINYNDFQILLENIQEAMQYVRVKLVAFCVLLASYPKMIVDRVREDDHLWDIAYKCSVVGIAVMVTGATAIAFVMIA